MMGWLKNMTFSNGDVPMVNDSTFGIAPTTRQLAEYATRLGLEPSNVTLSDSGYRMVRTNLFELLVDIGQIGPDYIPGHAHSDTLSYILHCMGMPLIVDTGVSTYDKGPRRMVERSTSSHNTVEVNGSNQSEVWSSFRVGRRACVFQVAESRSEITASHDGYLSLGVIHRRTWKWSEMEVVVVDELEGSGRESAVASLHIHPDYVPVVDGNMVTLGPLRLLCEGGTSLSIEPYLMSTGFNANRTGHCVKIMFEKFLTTRLLFSKP
jgi:hypothetical protein